MFPDELCSYRQWVVWRAVPLPNGKVTKVPYCATDASIKASTSDPATWSDFQTASNTAQRLVCGIGFVLTENDPYNFIDLDNPVNDPATPKESYPEIYSRQKKIEEAFDSYSEVSPNNGLHIIIKGASFTHGRKRNKIEIYSCGRFMTMTGRTFRDKPIEERTGLARTLWDEIGGGDPDAEFKLVEQAQRMDDRAIYDQAREAENGEKFLSLWEGRWIDHYKSQSEADFALINILGFYSRNQDQIRRLFLQSALGARDKAKRTKYLNDMIRRSFDNQIPMLDLSELDANLQRQLAAKENSMGHNPNPFSGPLFANVPDSSYTYTNPPGLLGEITDFIYEASPRQVREIALASAIGLMSGMCGRSYNISKTGLNQYILVLAGTGTGKEGMITGIDRLLRAVRVRVPAVMEFLGPSAIASGQALIKHLATQPCFVSVLGEFGLLLQTMCSLHANPGQILLRKTLLELYMKSGRNEVMRSTIYSEQSKNTPIVACPSFSILGESTPEAYYDGLDESMIAQGLLPRFLCIQYEGRVPHFNEKHAQVEPSESLIQKIADLSVNCFQLQANTAAIDVEMDSEATIFAREFSHLTTDKVNSTEVDIAKHLWNRAHLKMLKLSALIALGINPFRPVVTLDCMRWAHDLVNRDIKSVFTRFEAGKIGSGTTEHSQLAYVFEIIKDYLISPFHERMITYGTTFEMHRDKVLPLSYLSRHTLNKGQFKNDRMGATNALKRCIENLVSEGVMREIRQIDINVRYGRTAKAWGVVNSNHFL